MARRVDHDRTGAEAFLFWRGVAPAQDRLNTQNYFARAERLRHVIISPKFQTDDAVDFLRLGRQHHDWNVACSRIAFQNLADFQARHLRQHEIKNDESRLFRARLVQTGGAIRGGRDNEPARLTQVQRKQIDNVALVLDDQDSFAGGRLHSQQLFATELSCRVRHASRCDSGLLV